MGKGERVRSLEGEEEEASFSTLLFFFGDAASGGKESSAHISSRRRGRRKQEWTEGLSFKEGRGFMQQCRLDENSLELFLGNLFFHMT